MWTAYSTEHLSGTERFEYWYSIVSQAHFRTTMASDHLDDFLASSQALHLGDIQTFAQSYPPMHARRTPAMIRQSDPEVCQLWITVRGGVALSQSGRDVEVGEGDLVLYDSSQPRQAWTAACGHPNVSSLILQIPRARLPLHSNTLDQLTLTRIQGQTGIGALFRHYLTDLMNHAPQYEECDALRLANVTLDLLSAMLAEAARTEDLLSPETQQTVLRTRINAFIQQHLGDPGLTPAAVAAAHQISVRYLHRLYQGEGTTIADGIRRSRLRRIHRDLVDPRLTARSISSIAARWGFPEPTHFSRAFKTLYGITPRDHRHQAQHGGAQAVR
ncbi:helix-turn-helix domain-containing protein [Streptomyces sp. NPDC020766]|uniref:AraC-like ligand-binding domain-containing protein n=1 Tax=Streptomyces sp. NPDC020766 TaxID=3155011 RepID=UPI0033E02D6D